MKSSKASGVFGNLRAPVYSGLVMHLECMDDERLLKVMMLGELRRKDYAIHMGQGRDGEIIYQETYKPIRLKKVDERVDEVASCRKSIIATCAANSQSANAGEHLEDIQGDLTRRKCFCGLRRASLSQFYEVWVASRFKV